MVVTCTWTNLPALPLWTLNLSILRVCVCVCVCLGWLYYVHRGPWEAFSIHVVSFTLPGTMASFSTGALSQAPGRDRHAQCYVHMAHSDAPASILGSSEHHNNRLFDISIHLWGFINWQLFFRFLCDPGQYVHTFICAGLCILNPPLSPLSLPPSLPPIDVQCLFTPVFVPIIPCAIVFVWAQ